jgi:hypothetical protein
MNWQQNPAAATAGSFHHLIIPPIAQRGTLNMRNVIEKSAVYTDFFIAGPAGLQ